MMFVLVQLTKLTRQRLSRTVRFLLDANAPRIMGAVLLLSVLASGCSTSAVDSSSTSSGSVDSGIESEAADDTPMSEPVAVSLELVTYEKLLAELRSLRGKIVVLDIWSTSCIPCMREFPNLVALQNEYPDQLACVSLNVDYIGLKSKSPESYLPSVRAFLEKQAATTLNFAGSESDEVFLQRFQVGSMPAILIYDAQGELIASLTDSNSGDDGLTYEGDVLPLIARLLSATDE